MSHAQSQDDAFREIQLNGKQLVFLFMAATVVSVVIFLCGVLVGRGVKAERSTAPEAARAGDTTPDLTPQPPPNAPAPTVAAGADPREAAPPPAVDDLTYYNRLEKPNAPSEDLKPAATADAEPPPASAPRAVTPPAADAPKPAAAKAPGPPSAPAAEAAATGRADTLAAPPVSTLGYALQVAALKERGDAEVIAKRLTAKGYAAYVLVPVSGSPSVYRVRVGKFKTRREAESVAAKLQKEEQFNPWITR